MNSIKTAIVVTVLLVVGYAVYQALYNAPGTPLPAEPADGWPTSVEVQVPGGNGLAEKSPSSHAGSSSSTGSTSAPPFSPVPPFTPDAAPKTPGSDPFAGFPAVPKGSSAVDSPAMRPSHTGWSEWDKKDSRPSGPTAGKSNAPGGESGMREASPFWETPTVPVIGANASEKAGTGRTEASPNAVDPFARGGASQRDNAASHDITPVGKQERQVPPSPAVGGLFAKPDDPASPKREFRAVLDAAYQRIDRGELGPALLELSKHFGSPTLSESEQRELTAILDQLAGTVIYSREHILEKPYTVRPGETLQRIAADHRVPWQLLAKVNGIQNPADLEPGRQLKVVRGPFDAEIHLDRYELVLTVNGYYAGRFAIGIGRDQSQLEGKYQVRAKMAQPTYYGLSGTVPAGDPANPLGRFLIQLDDRIAIHGTNDPQNVRRSSGRGTICLAESDIEDVYDILTTDVESGACSKVTIRR